MFETQASQRPYYVRKLREEFLRREKRNSSYSIRSFARALEIHPSTLSAVMKGRRPLPPKYAVSLASKLDLLPRQKENFVQSILTKQSLLESLGLQDQIPKVDEKVLEEEAHYKVISEWEHYTLFELLETPDCQSSSDWISLRLGISSARAKEITHRLIDTGLIFRDGNFLRKSKTALRTSNDVNSQALQEAHQENLDLASEKLKNIPLEQREFNAAMVAMDPEQMPELKNIIRNFLKKIEKKAAEGKPKEVFQICVQAYPMTKQIKKGKRT